MSAVPYSLRASIRVFILPRVSLKVLCSNPSWDDGDRRSHLWSIGRPAEKHGHAKATHKGINQFEAGPVIIIITKKDDLER